MSRTADGYDGRNSTTIDRKRNDRSRETLETQLQQNTFTHLGILNDIAKSVKE